MTHLSYRAAALTAACLTLASAADVVRAQCTTCATPTVAYSPVVAAAPVVAAPTAVVVQRPGLFDRWRMRRWGVTAPVVVAPTYTAGYAPAYTAGYAPTYTAGYAPTYTAAYAPAYTAAYAPTAAYATYTAGYTPYYSAYAPLQPATVYRPAVLSPVVASYAPAAPACDACAVTSSYAAAPACSACSASSYVDQASYAAPAAGCACAGAALPSSSYPAGTSSSDPLTPVPQIPTDVGTPVGSGYAPESSAPATEAGASSDTFQAPPLMGPANGHTASRPSVDVHTAVYRRPVPASSVSTSTAPSRAVDDGAWGTAPSSR